MAYVPDSISEHLHTLTKTEIVVFFHYCKTRNADTGGWRCPDIEVAEAVRFARNSVCEARRSLITKGWIKFREADWFVIPVKGFEGRGKKPVATATEGVATATEGVATATEGVATATEGVATATEGVATATVSIPSHDQPMTSQQHARAHAREATLPDDGILRDAIAAIVRERTGHTAIRTQKAERAVNGEVAEILQSGATLADVQAFEAQRRRPITLGYYARDFLRWFGGNGSPKGKDAIHEEAKRLLGIGR